MTGFSSFIRTATRPFLTATGLIAWVMFIESGVDPPTEFTLTVVGMLGTWFGERFITRIQGK